MLRGMVCHSWCDWALQIDPQMQRVRTSVRSYTWLWHPCSGIQCRAKYRQRKFSYTQTQTHWFQSTWAHSSWCWDSHLLVSSTTGGSCIPVVVLVLAPNTLLLVPTAAGTWFLRPSHTHGTERLCRGRVRKGLNWKPWGAMGRAQRNTMAAQFYTWPAP